MPLRGAFWCIFLCTKQGFYFFKFRVFVFFIPLYAMFFPTKKPSFFSRPFCTRWTWTPFARTRSTSCTTPGELGGKGEVWNFQKRPFFVFFFWGGECGGQACGGFVVEVGDVKIRQVD